MTRVKDEASGWQWREGICLVQTQDQGNCGSSVIIDPCWKRKTEKRKKKQENQCKGMDRRKKNGESKQLNKLDRKNEQPASVQEDASPRKKKVRV